MQQAIFFYISWILEHILIRFKKIFMTISLNIDPYGHHLISGSVHNVLISFLNAFKVLQLTALDYSKYLPIYQ